MIDLLWTALGGLAVVTLVQHRSLQSLRARVVALEQQQARRAAQAATIAPARPGPPGFQGHQPVPSHHTVIRGR